MATLAHVGGSRWRIETEFEAENSGVRLGEYAVRARAGWHRCAGWHYHIAMRLQGGAFVLARQQDGKPMPLITRPQVDRAARYGLPRERFGPEELLFWLEGIQLRNARA